MARALKAVKRSGQKALVVGVSDYPPPIPKLPAVAADVREIAKLLQSKNGAFSSSGVAVLTDKQANRKSIQKELSSIFEGAAADDTLFVYLAGHGGVQKDKYYFYAHDTAVDNLPATGLALSEIKSFFDQTRSGRVFLWLDFCHSGGILARGLPSSDDATLIRRTLEVIRGEGKIIVAACTPSQSAYECPIAGHGLFTDALLRGLKGGAESDGEVTANSLFDYIDRRVGSQRQRPMYFGHMTGRIVLMHLSGRSNSNPVPRPPKQSKPRPAKSDGTWVMLGPHYFLASSVRSNSDGTLTIVIPVSSGEDEANLKRLIQTPFGYGSNVTYAWNAEAGTSRVQAAESEMAAGSHAWTVTLAPQKGSSGGLVNEMSIMTGSQTYSADDIARLRAGRILLNDPPPADDRARSFSNDMFLESCIRGSIGGCDVRESPIRRVFSEHGNNPNWKHYARLQCVYALLTSGTVDSIIDLSLGAVRANGVQVRFKGRRDRHGVQNSTPIEIAGVCPLV